MSREFRLIVAALFGLGFLAAPVMGAVGVGGDTDFDGAFQAALTADGAHEIQFTANAKLTMTQNGTDLTTLQAIAAAGGGRVLAQPSGAFANNLQATTAPAPLQWPLLLLALLLFPLDVGVRRLAISRADVRALWRAVTAPRGKMVIETEHPALAGIRKRRNWTQPAPGAPGR